MNILRQIGIVSLINFKSLRSRLWRSLVIVVGMACVIGVLLSMLSLTEGMMTAYAKTGDPDRALAFARRIRTGQIDVNGGVYNPLAPFGGYKQSGVGREMGRLGMDEFLEVKSIQL